VRVFVFVALSIQTWVCVRAYAHMCVCVCVCTDAAVSNEGDSYLLVALVGTLVFRFFSSVSVADRLVTLCSN
jgi:ABC-type polysaccharide/polyol phosphate export permease